MTPGSRLDPDRTLALSYVPTDKRPALAALWELDAALANVALGGREPMIARIKLAWWRDTLGALDEKPPPGEPVLQALAERVLPHLSGFELTRLAECWEGPEELEACARARGGLLFVLSARLLGEEGFPDLERAGESWSLADLARWQGRKPDNHPAEEQPPRWPVPLRPLGMLAVLAARDAAREKVERQGSPARMLRMLHSRLTGR